MARETGRLTAREILENVLASARDELERSSRALAFSGFAAGLTIGLTGLAVAAVSATVGPGGMHRFVAMLFFPVGFVAVIIGRQQLFTENTLYPIVLLLDERRGLRGTARLWAIVFATNIVGTLAFAALAMKTGALHADVAHELSRLGATAVKGDFQSVFVSGIIGGWLIALVAWIVSAAHWTIGQVVIIWTITFVVGIAQLAHCIASSAEILSSVLVGDVSVSSYLAWLAASTLGNVVGGVGIVSLLNYGQVAAGEAR